MGFRARPPGVEVYLRAHIIGVQLHQPANGVDVRDYVEDVHQVVCSTCNYAAGKLSQWAQREQPWHWQGQLG